MLPALKLATVLAAILNIPNLKGVVLETYGAGNAPTEDWFLNLLKKAIGAGLHIINVTQCSGGSVRMGQYETSTGMKAIGVISTLFRDSQSHDQPLVFRFAN